MKYALEFFIGLGVMFGIGSGVVYLAGRYFKKLPIGPGRWKVKIQSHANGQCEVCLVKRGARVSVGWVQIDSGSFEDDILELESEARSKAATLNVLR